METDNNDQFSLCWDNFLTNMSSGLNSLLKSEDLVDVTLAAEGRYLKAHKMILSVCSPYFKELFQVNPCKHPIVFLKDVSYSILKNLLEFMYMGEVKVSHNDLPTFIKTAEALKIKGLTGDSQNQSEITPESEAPSPAPVQTPIKTGVLNEAVTLTRKPTREKSPPPRKKMLGPASKRFKTDNEYVKPQQTEQKIIENSQFESQMALVNDSAPVKPPPLAPLTALKLEPEEDMSNHEDTTYDEPIMDELGLDGTTDYMDSADDSKAGTSTDVVNAEIPGENQGKGQYKFVVTQLGTLNLVLHNHLYRPRNMIHGTEQRVWVCTWRTHCPARAISFRGKLIAKRGMHNHPPQKDVIVSREQAGQICYRSLF